MSREHRTELRTADAAVTTPMRQGGLRTPPDADPDVALDTAIANDGALPSDTAELSDGDPHTVDAAPSEEGSAPKPSPPARRYSRTALRLATFHAVVLSSVLGVVAVALTHQFSTSYQALAASTLDGELHSFSSAVSRGVLNDGSLLAFSSRYVRSHSLPPGDQLVISVIGKGAVPSRGLRAIADNTTVVSSLSRPPRQTLLFVARVGSSDDEVLTAPIRVGKRPVGTFVATTNLAVVERQRSNAILLIVAEAAVAVAAGAMSAYLLLRRLLRTIGMLTATAGEIEQGDLERRLGDPGTGDEVSHLAHTFDRMLDRISSAMAAQRRLLSDVSHQLRTPMTVARGHLEVLDRTGYADKEGTEETVGLVLDELEQMGSMVDQLLMLGRAIEPDFLEPELVDLRAFFADVYEAARVFADRQWLISVVPDVLVWADPAKLRGAFLNLVDNAVKFTHCGQPIVLSAGISVSGTIELAIEDCGPGIPPDQRLAVLERFKRATGHSVPGTGLGLAIVDAVARAHGGGVQIHGSALGGARVSIVLPAAAVRRPGWKAP